MPEKKYKLCYPQLGNYDIPIQYFVNNGLHLEYLAPPAMTNEPLNLVQNTVRTSSVHHSNV